MATKIKSNKKAKTAKTARKTTSKTTAKSKLVKTKAVAKPKTAKATKTAKKPKKAKLDLSDDVLPVPRKRDLKFKGYIFDNTDNNVVNYCKSVGMKPQNFCFIINRLSCGKTLAETLVSYKKFVPSSKLMMESMRRISIRFDKLITKQKKLRKKYLKLNLKKVNKSTAKSKAQRLHTRKHIPEWKITFCENVGPDGLPILSEHHSHLRPNYEQLDMPIEELFKKISTYTKPELRHIIRYRTMDKQSLSMQTLSLVQLYLDTLHSNPKVRASALKYIIDRRYGSVINRIGNPDGSKLDPFSQLLEVEKAKLKPAGS